MANRRFIDFPIASTSGDTDIILIWQGGANKQTTKATFLSGLPENLDELNDVAISGLTNGQILRYDSVTGKWENTDQGNLDLNDLNDVSIVSPSNGQVLVYNSSTSKWENSSGGFVPYVGAVTTVDLGAQGLRAGYVRFDTTVAGVPQEQGVMFWDADDETVDIILNGYTMKIGEDLFYPVKNQTGSTIAKGVAVRFNGTLGASGRLLIAPFIADGSVPSSRFMGVTAEEILNGEDGKVLYFGRVRGINTNAFNEGDILYASTTVAGGYQTAIPVAPNNIVQVAAVVTKSATVGTIFVRPTLGSNINKDEGVKITSVADKNLLQYQSGTALWENKTLAQVLGGTSSQFVKGDGSLDSTSYGTGTVTSVGLSSATSGVTIGSTPVTTSGTITLAIATASGSQNGLLSSTDWTTFNNKQNALTNPVTGTGTTNYLPKFTGASTIGNSIVQDLGYAYILPSGAEALRVANDNVFLSFYNSSNTTRRGYIQAQSTALTIAAEGSFMQFQTPSGIMRLDASGNLGLGVTPSAGWVQGKALEVGFAGTGIWGRYVNEAHFTMNYYYSNSLNARVYASNNPASDYEQFNGNHVWYNAPSGTAGNPISFTQAMTLFSTGNLLVGSPSPISDNGARLQVSGTATVDGVAFIGQVPTYGTDFTQFSHISRAGANQYSFLSQNNGGTYVNSHNSQSIFFRHNNSNLAVITSGGNVGIGTSSPSGLLDLKAASGATIFNLINNASTLSAIVYQESGANKAFVQYLSSTFGTAARANSLEFGTIASGSFIAFRPLDAEAMRITSGGNVLIGTTTDVGVRLNVLGSSGNIARITDGTNHFTFYAGSGLNEIATISPLLLTVAGSERMRINAAGFTKAATNGTYRSGASSDGHEFGDNLSSDFNHLTIFAQSTSCAGNLFRMVGNRTSTNGSFRFIEASNGNDSGRFLVLDSGNVQNTNGSYGAISDIKLKENITDATPKLQDLLKVKIKNFNFKNSESKQIGVIAQELEEIFPSLIDSINDTDKEGRNLGTKTKSVKYSVFIPMLIKAIQELKQEIDTLKN